MMTSGKKLFYASAIRLSIIPIKFSFILYLTKAIDLTALGQYGLIAALSSYCIYLIGLEVHSHVNRIGIGGSRDQWNELLGHQLGLYFLMVALFTSITIFAEKHELIEVPYVTFFILITVVEHFGQESYRTLIALQDQFFASLTLFLRLALWPLIIILYGILGGAVSLNLVFTMWIVFGAIGSIAGYLYIINKYARGPRLRLKLNRMWVKEAVKISSIFLFCTLTLRIAQTADRYLVGLFDQPEILGKYSFYAMISLSISSMLTFIGPGRIYPELIVARKKRDWQKYSDVYYKMIKEGLIFSTSIALASLAFIYRASSYSVHEVFDIRNIEVAIACIFLCLILMTYNLCLQYLAYSQQQDMRILISNIASIISAALALAAFEYFSTINVNSISVSAVAFYLAGVISKKTLITAPTNTKRLYE